ncbi:MAG: multiheme c-type cytochrome [Candidatus Scalinduaceae bacterium]
MTVALFCILILFSNVIKADAEHESSLYVTPNLSEQTQVCILCHMKITPGIVEDWKTSRHSKMTPEMAIKKPALERRISSDSIPEALMAVAVGCYECHSQNPSIHKDNFDHFSFKINVIVSPNDCKTCHSVEVDQYSISKKAYALDNLQKNPLYHTLVETLTSTKKIEGNEIIDLESSENTKLEACYSCHGSMVSVDGTRKISTGSGDIDVPNLINWPNQGVGRINPDGSRGACTPCHPRHSFSIEIARKPYTCSQCHLEPDVPGFEVYKDSKHGNIFSSKQHEWNWDNVPWRVGKDFTAPTCTVCHNSLIVTEDNKVIESRTHNFGSRLWVRLFGLPYSHPQPKTGKTYLIKNKDGLPLPTAFDGELSAEYLIDKDEQMQRQNVMKKICRCCHNIDLINQHFTKMDSTIAETDKMTLAATQLLLQAWNEGLEDQSNPFDEMIERRWLKQWFFNANSIRFGSAMGGYDYIAFKNGWFQLIENLHEMQEMLALKKILNKNGIK